jgi:adenine-specific DNA-methyltransferase
MSRKHDIISALHRDELKSIINALDIPGVDRRSSASMCDALASDPNISLSSILTLLPEAAIKEVCEHLELSPKGRKRALIDFLSAYAASDDASTIAAPDDDDADDDPSPTDAPRADNTRTPSPSPLPPPAAPARAITRTELIWPGKYDDQGHLVEPPRLSLPFQVVETIHEGRALRGVAKQKSLLSFFNAPPQNTPDHWRNKLIWGDNLLVTASLLQDFAGKIDLIYIDPPFATGADFSFSAMIGEDGIEIEKKQSMIESKAYRDTWGRGLPSYLQMIHHRLLIMKELLSDQGSIYIHLDDHVSHYVKIMMDELFGTDFFINEIVWQRTNAHNMKMRYYPRVHDVILYYGKTENYLWDSPLGDFSEEQLKRYRPDNTGRLFTGQDLTVSSKSNTRKETWRGTTPPANRSWAASIEERERLWEEGRILLKTDGTPRLDGYKVYLDEKVGRKISSLWTDISRVGNTSSERLDYATQKPEALLERIIKTSSEPDSIVADFFCGSGTTLAVAEKLGRRWIGADLGRFAVHTARKRLMDIQVMDEQTGEERGCRPFEILNLGKYERKHWQGITFGNEPRSEEAQALADYVDFMLKLYRARPVEGVNVHGKKGAALVHVGAIDAPVTISQIEEAAAETKLRGAKELHILGWEFEMGLYNPVAQYIKAQQGVTVRLKLIPREVMEQRAVEVGDIQFFDLAFLELDVVALGKGAKKNLQIKVKLNNFVIPSTDLIPQEVRDKIKKWSDYIDYWAIDWDFRNDTFTNQWQTYRTRQDRALPLESDPYTYKEAGRYQVLVKVVDIFGNDTSHLVQWDAS